MKGLPISKEAFLEFYGIMLGDGWISTYMGGRNRKSEYYAIGVTGNINEDKYLLKRVKKSIEQLFKAKINVKYRLKDNALELVFYDKELALTLNRELKFPIGLKNDLFIPRKFLIWKKLKPLLRGLFDTDGTLYFDKAEGYVRSYPVIEFYMKAPRLIKQITKQLKNKGYHVTVSKNRSRIRLKGFKQCKRWFKEIKPANNKHIKKYNRYVAPVAQPG